MRGEVSLRMHHATRSQLENYPFKRRRPGVTSKRLSLRLESDFPVAQVAHGRISGRLSREAARLDAAPYSESLLDEAFVDFFPVGNWRLKIGRQLVALGLSEYFQVLDVATPRDQRIFGLVDLRESRLPVMAARLGFEQNRSGGELVLKHEFRSNRYGAPQSDFDPYIAFGGFNQTEPGATPNLQRRPDAILHWYSFEPWGDVHAVAADVFDSTPVPVDFENGKLKLGFQRTKVFGVGANYVKGDWVFKSELARRNAVRQLRADIAEQTASGLRPIVSEQRPMTEWMLGARYSGFSGLTVDAELLNQFIGGHSAQLADPSLQSLGVLNLMWAGYHDKLRLELLLGRWWGGSRLLRAQIGYDISDRWQVNGGYLQYIGGSSGAPLYPYRNNDRLVVNIIYSL
ncbi:hypothetical protein EGT07_13530 [Herbaspirillum sp. HC18]|nr:hypothetical protein EGT07_13530 [Herbaspirillum sp. HC18]